MIPTKNQARLMLVALVACGASEALGQASGVMSNPIYNPANGHYYAYVTANAPGVLWDVAHVEAPTIQYLGVAGHMATVTTAAENQFLIDNLKKAVIDMYWLGGYQLPGSPEPDGGWVWVTGEVFSYHNWEPSNPEPNNGSGRGEEVLAMWRVNWDDPYVPGQVIGWWNDEPNWYAGKGYIIEFPFTGIPLELDWHTVDCGGGIITVDNLEIFSSIGQFDVGVPLINGTTELRGGFVAAP